MKQKQYTKMKIIKYIVLAVFIIICLGISFYTFSTKNILYYIEQNFNFYDSMEGRTYVDFIIYTAIEGVCYGLLSIMMLGALIKERFTAPSSKQLYISFICITVMTGIIEFLKFQKQYVSYFPDRTLIMTGCVVGGIIVSIMGYFVLGEDEQLIKQIS